jgi:hypothetical protein
MVSSFVLEWGECNTKALFMKTKSHYKRMNIGTAETPRQEFEPQSHYEITSHPKTNIEPQRRGGRRDQREKRFIYRYRAGHGEHRGRAERGLWGWCS